MPARPREAHEQSDEMGWFAGWRRGAAAYCRDQPVFAAPTFACKSYSCKAAVMGDFIAVDLREVSARGQTRSEANP